MRREQSQQSARADRDRHPAKKPVGSLFLAGVPIGHPDDITLRTLSVLSTVDIVATEDALATQSLLRHHNLSPHLTSYGPTRIKEKVAVLIGRLQQGASVALVSDCGSPVISDPGSLLVAAAHKHNIPVRSLPGPSAVTAAVAASGFPAEAFHFYGDMTTRDRPDKRLDCILAHAEPSILFCQPESCLKILKDIAKTAPRRKVALVCNLTLPKETILRGTVGHISKLFGQIQQPQEVTIIVEGRKPVTATVKRRARS